MKEIKVAGQKRTDLGKKASKQLREEGLVPCNLYGEAQKEAIGIVIHCFYGRTPQVGLHSTHLRCRVGY